MILSVRLSKYNFWQLQKPPTPNTILFFNEGICNSDYFWAVQRACFLSCLSPSPLQISQIHCLLFLCCTYLHLLFAVTWQRSLSCLLTLAKPSRVFLLDKSSLKSWWICSLQTDREIKTSPHQICLLNRHNDRMYHRITPYWCRLCEYDYSFLKSGGEMIFRD